MRRWRLIVLVVGTASAGSIIGWAWKDGLDPEHRQAAVLTTLATTIGWCVFAFVWWTLLSGLSIRTRFRGLLALAASLGILAVLFEYDGLSGDFVPRLRLRFAEVDVVRPDDPSTRHRHLDWPGYLGAHRDASVEGVELEPDWTSHPPKLLWRREVGKGWSSFAVASGLAVTQEQHGGEEQVVCYELASSEVRWRVRDDAAYLSGVAGDGPRATPCIADGSVYTLGSTGILRATALDEGTPRWRRDLAAEEGAELPDWGFAGSPLVHDGRVIVPVGGRQAQTLVAYDAATGERRWSVGDDDIGYASCALHEVLGTTQLVLFHDAAISGHDPRDGRELWQYEWQGLHPNAAQPLQVSDRSFVLSTGYGVGAARVGVQRQGEAWSVEFEWRSRHLKSKFSNFVRHQNSLYGLDDGTLCCVSLDDGSRRWKEGRHGHGQMVQVKDMLLILAENGEVILHRMHPEEPRELGRFRALDSETWNPPAFAAPLLLVRNVREAALWEIPLRAAPEGF